MAMWKGRLLPFWKEIVAVLEASHHQCVCRQGQEQHRLCMHSASILTSRTLVYFMCACMEARAHVSGAGSFFLALWVLETELWLSDLAVTPSSTEPFNSPRVHFKDKKSEIWHGGMQKWMLWVCVC